MTDKDNQRKAIARQFLDLVADGKMSMEAIADHLSTTSVTLKKWASWFYPDEVKANKWALETSPKRIAAVEKPQRKTRTARTPKLVHIPIPTPPKKHNVTAMVFSGDASSVGEMVRQALAQAGGY